MRAPTTGPGSTSRSTVGDVAVRASCPTDCNTAGQSRLTCDDGERRHDICSAVPASTTVRHAHLRKRAHHDRRDS
jgi:hypothetical protein